MKVSIIGSFRRHYKQVQPIVAHAIGLGLSIGSPKGDEVIDPESLFVHFSSDNPALTDAQVQTIALHRILSSDLVYVVAPRGYVGRTTCYEIGRIVERGVPLYFSRAPKDLPLHVPSAHVIPPASFKRLLTRRTLHPTSLYNDPHDPLQELERRLAVADFLVE